MIYWNLSHRRKRIKNSDIVVISVAKSGRTWLRVFFNKYFSLKHSVPFDVYLTKQTNRPWPNIFFTHEKWEHVTHAKLSQKINGKYLIPNHFLKKRKIILLYRDPRDIVTSLYYHKTKRDDECLDMSKHDFLRHNLFGINNIIDILNGWHNRFSKHKNCLWISYEQLIQDKNNIFTELVTFAENNDVDKKLIEQALDFSEFKNMKSLEKQRSFQADILTPRNENDYNSYKVRKGIIGDYINEFSQEDIIFMNKAMERLHPFFGYTVI